MLELTFKTYLSNDILHIKPTHYWRIKACRIPQTKIKNQIYVLDGEIDVLGYNVLAVQPTSDMHPQLSEIGTDMGKSFLLFRVYSPDIGTWLATSHEFMIDRNRELIHNNRPHMRTKDSVKENARRAIIHVTKQYHHSCKLWKIPQA